jgi:hypothetical protein
VPLLPDRAARHSLAKPTKREGDFQVACDLWKSALGGPEGSSESFYLNSSTLSNGLAAHGRKRLRVNLVFSPGFTFTST